MEISGTMDVTSGGGILLEGDVTTGGTTTMTGTNISQNANMVIGGALTLTASNNMLQNGNTTVAGDMKVTAGKDFLMASGTFTKVTAGNFVSEAGGNTTLQLMEISGTMDVTSGGDISLENDVTVAGNTNMSGTNITQNAKLTIGGTTTLTAENDINQNAEISSVSDVSLDAKNQILMGADGATIVQDGELSYHAESNLILSSLRAENGKVELVSVSGDVGVSKAINAKNITVKGVNFVLDGTLVSSENITIEMKEEINLNDNLSAGGDVSLSSESNLNMSENTLIKSTSGDVSLAVVNDLVLSQIEARQGVVALVIEEGILLDSEDDTGLNIVANSLSIDGQGAVHTERLSTDNAVSYRGRAIETSVQNLLINSNIVEAQNLLLDVDSSSFVIASNGEDWSLLLVNVSTSLNLEQSNLESFFVYVGSILESTNIEENQNSEVSKVSSKKSILDIEVAQVLEIENDLFEEFKAEVLKKEALVSVESYGSFYNQLNFIYDSGMPLFDLYSSEDYDESQIINSNAEYWTEDIAI